MLMMTLEVQSKSLLPIRVTGSRSLRGASSVIAALAIHMFSAAGRLGRKPEEVGREVGDLAKIFIAWCSGSRERRWRELRRA